MEVKLQSGDAIAIPEGCKAVVKDGIVTIEKDFEDGDVLHSVYDDLMLIYKESRSSESFNSHFNMIHNHNTGWNIRAFRHATEEEKRLLFDKMKERGLRWNAEEKRVEKMRWHPVIGGLYYFVCMDIHVSRATYQDRCFDRDKIAAGNCFRTNDQAEEAARRVKETLRKYHEETGE